MIIKYIYSISLVSAIFIATATEIIDKDNDGVNDSIDQCLNTAQIKRIPENFKYAIAVNPERLKPGKQAHPVDSRGCEFDNDGDGVVNSQDYCPDDTPKMLSKGVASNGCAKHSDFDGTPDYRDKCPHTPKNVRTDASGCPIVGSTSQ